MSVTISTMTSFDSDYSLVSEKYAWNIGFNPESVIMEDIDESNLSFYSERPKMVLRLPISFYHCAHDFLGTVISIFELNPETLFIIDISLSSRTPSAKSISDFCFKLLDYHNINYDKVDLAGMKRVNMNNFYTRTTRVIDHNAPNLVIQYAMPFIKDKDIKPFRKVYVSRKELVEYKKKDYGVELSKKLTRNTYNRVDDEEKLEEFFLQNGFEIITPESFNSFEDQLNYFYEVETIIGITGGGLTNTMFMKDGGTVVELMTTLITPISAINNFDTKSKRVGLEEGQHHFYHAIAFRKNFNYIGVPNQNAKAETIIKRILEYPAFAFLSSKSPS